MLRRIAMKWKMIRQSYNEAMQCVCGAVVAIAFRSGANLANCTANKRLLHLPSNRRASAVRRQIDILGQNASWQQVVQNQLSDKLNGSALSDHSINWTETALEQRGILEVVIEVFLALAD